MKNPTLPDTFEGSVSLWDIIPDVHGHSHKLVTLLEHLGYQKQGGAYCHPDPTRKALFLGDLIDRGTDNAGTIDIVRRMVDGGHALAIMGNHELNALHYAYEDSTGRPLRARTERNTQQHQSFLDEFPLKSPEAQAQLDWIMSLPLFVEIDGFRAVHASWCPQSIETVLTYCDGPYLSKEHLVASSRPHHPLHKAIERLLKGPEIDLPDGVSYADKDGQVRKKSRLAWWASNAESWADITASVPDPEATFRNAIFPEDLTGQVYAANAPPVFFGHYWMSGDPVLQSHNALCLDYSAGYDGPLISYCHKVGSEVIDLKNLDYPQMAA